MLSEALQSKDSRSVRRRLNKPIKSILSCQLSANVSYFASIKVGTTSVLPNRKAMRKRWSLCTWPAFWIHARAVVWDGIKARGDVSQRVRVLCRRGSEFGDVHRAGV